MIRVVLVTLTGFILSCGSSRDNRRSDLVDSESLSSNEDAQPKAGSQSGVDKDPRNASKEEELRIATREEPAPLGLRDGSKLGFLPPNALSSRFRRVFKPSANGYAHCARPPVGSFRGDYCGQLFDSKELRFIGHFGLHSSAVLGPITAEKIDGLTLNYTKSLRSMLLRECRTLVLKENETPNAPSNLLVQGSTVPSSLALQSFHKRILGIDGTNIAVDFPAEAYAAAAEKILAQAQPRDKPSVRLNATISLCVAIGMDPTITLY
jgi:hypothetical protein